MSRIEGEVETVKKILLPEAMDRITALEARLEISPHTKIDGIDARDATIRMLEAENAELRKEIERMVNHSRTFRVFD